MAARPLSEREALPYLVVFVGLFTAASYVPAAVVNIWDQLGAAWSIALAALGTIYIYWQNGGADGEYFLQRYFAIGWVVTIRWAVIMILLAVVFFAVMRRLGEGEETTWYEFVFWAASEAIVYWRIGFHVRDLAQRTRVA